jgi:hypothetical protein
MDLRNVGILPQHYTASQPRRTRIFTAVKASNLARRLIPFSTAVHVAIWPMQIDNEEMGVPVISPFK